MPKLILRCNYLKNAPPSHLANYMNYISTREGVEKIDNTYGLLLATVRQKELIADILSKSDMAESSIIETNALCSFIPIFDCMDASTYNIRILKKSGEIKRIRSTKAGTWEIL